MIVLDHDECTAGGMLYDLQADQIWKGTSLDNCDGSER
jgi:hypothetical protein